MSKLLEIFNNKIKELLDSRAEELSKRAPEGVDPEKHERCVKKVKKKSHDVGSAHAICTSAMTKEEEGPDMADPDHPKGLETKRKPVTHDECGRPFAKSNYGPKDFGLYSPTNNSERKRTRTGEEVEGVGRNKGVRRYTSAKMGTSKQQAADQAKLDSEKNKKQPVKLVSASEMDPELKAKLEAEANNKKFEKSFKTEILEKVRRSLIIRRGMPTQIAPKEGFGTDVQRVKSQGDSLDAAAMMRPTRGANTAESHRQKVSQKLDEKIKNIMQEQENKASASPQMSDEQKQAHKDKFSAQSAEAKRTSDIKAQGESEAAANKVISEHQAKVDKMFDNGVIGKQQHKTLRSMDLNSIKAYNESQKRLKAEEDPEVSREKAISQSQGKMARLMREHQAIKDKIKQFTQKMIDEPNREKKVRMMVVLNELQNDAKKAHGALDRHTDRHNTLMNKDKQ